MRGRTTSNPLHGAPVDLCPRAKQLSTFLFMHGLIFTRVPASRPIEAYFNLLLAHQIHLFFAAMHRLGHQGPMRSADCQIVAEVQSCHVI